MIFLRGLPMKQHASSLGIAIIYDLIPQGFRDRKVVEIRLVTPGEAGDQVAKATDTVYSCSYTVDPDHLGRDVALKLAHRWAEVSCAAPVTYLGAFPKESAVWQ